MKTHSLASLFVIATLSQAASADDAEAETKKKGLDVFGVVEVEAGFVNADAGNTSDVTLATVEFGMDYIISKKADAHLLFLYEEGENNDEIAVDEAVISLHPTKNISISAGRKYVPFGSYSSHMVSDPLTLEIGETQEEIIQVGFSNEHVSGSVYTFKDDEDGSNKIDDFGANINFGSENFSGGVSYITDVNDKSDATNSAKGFGVHAAGSIGPTLMAAEHIAVNGMAGNVDPSATTLEVSRDLGKGRLIALSVQHTDDAAGLNLPEDAVGIAYSMPVHKNVNFAAEVMKNDAYDGTDDMTTTLQLSYGF